MSNVLVPSVGEVKTAEACFLVWLKSAGYK